MEWISARWQDLTAIGSGGWLAIAAWAALLFGIVVLIATNRHLAKNRQFKHDQVRPQVTMFMEPHASDWHLIELVVRNFGQTAAHNIELRFTDNPTVAIYEDSDHDGELDVTDLHLPSELTVLAPGQEWRTIWDSAISREQLGGSIGSRFDGAVVYYDMPRPDDGKRTSRFGTKRREFETKATLDWKALQPVQRLELMTTHDLAKREKQKLELLRSVLTYFHYASKETRSDIFRAEIDRMNRAVRETQDRWRTRQFDDTTELEFPWVDDSPQRSTASAPANIRLIPDRPQGEPDEHSQLRAVRSGRHHHP
ncbi:hypothetical protein ABIA30_001789 [Mycobacterium sp. MAA66]|uniref:hypothetical protein n=1 Tax=Mycobacterium sp. MAA66 TaxID=3156297 RepID=UPI003514D03A